MTHKVKKGETLSGIAAKYGVTVEAIKNANPIIINPNVIRVGWVLVIPTKSPSLKEAIDECLADIEALPSYQKVVQMLNE